MQNLFNKSLFVEEQKEYSEELTNWVPTPFEDNSLCVDLVDAKIKSVFSLLSDLNGELVRAKDQKVGDIDKKIVPELEKLCSSKPKVPHSDFFVKRHIKDNPLTFGIKHYAGPTKYNTDKWSLKNAGTLSDSLKELMKKITTCVVQDAFHQSKHSVAINNKPIPIYSLEGNKKTVCEDFKLSVDGLINILNKSDCHYIRCIKPNDLDPKSSSARVTWDAIKVFDQLLCNGIFESIKVRKAGYPSRIPFNLFKQRFKLLVPSQNDTIPLLNSIDPEGLTWKIGKSKYFFKDSFIRKLNERLSHIRSTLAIQSYIRRYNAYIVRDELLEDKSKLLREKLLKEQEEKDKILKLNETATIKANPTIKKIWQNGVLHNRPPGSPYSNTAYKGNRPSTAQQESNDSNQGYVLNKEARIFSQKKEEALKLAEDTKTEVPLYLINWKKKQAEQNKQDVIKGKETLEQQAKEESNRDLEDIRMIQNELTELMKRQNIQPNQPIGPLLAAVEKYLIRFQNSKEKVEAFTLQKEELLKIISLNERIDGFDLKSRIEERKQKLDQLVEENGIDLDFLDSDIVEFEDNLRGLDPIRNPTKYRALSLVLDDLKAARNCRQSLLFYKKQLR